MIVIDESESILNHFQSPTFKGNDRDVFEYMTNIIRASLLKPSSKIIAMDGDMSIRTFDFLKSFDRPIKFIHNRYAHSERKFIITDDRKRLETEIFQAIEAEQKLSICSMINADTEKYYKLLSEKYPNLRILLTNALSDDNLKLELYEIATNIQNYDVWIYSPSCESGVNVDIKGPDGQSLKYFQKLFCIIGPNSTTPRSFLQMTARIRHLSDQNILILNEQFTYNQHAKLETFEEQKQMVIKLRDRKLKRCIKISDGKLFEVLNLEPFDINYIHNQVELKNKEGPTFLKMLHVLCQMKGIEITYEKNTNDKFKVQRVKNDDKLIGILNAPDVSYIDYCRMCSNINKDKATKAEKETVMRYKFREKLGVDTIDKQIIDAYFYDSYKINNYLCLLDRANIENKKMSNEYKTDEALMRLEVLTDVLNILGFEHLFSTFKPTADELHLKFETIRKHKLIVEFKTTYKRIFNLMKFSIDVSDDKRMLIFINGLLKNYLIKIQHFRYMNRSKSSNAQTAYKLQHLNNIQEIVHYKITKGHKISDQSKIFKCKKEEFIFGHLIWPGTENEENDENDENDANFNLKYLDDGLSKDDDDGDDFIDDNF